MLTKPGAIDLNGQNTIVHSVLFRSSLHTTVKLCLTLIYYNVGQNVNHDNAQDGWHLDRARQNAFRDNGTDVWHCSCQILELQFYFENTHRYCVLLVRAWAHFTGPYVIRCNGEMPDKSIHVCIQNKVMLVTPIS